MTAEALIEDIVRDAFYSTDEIVAAIHEMTTEDIEDLAEEIRKLYDKAWRYDQLNKYP